MKCKHELCNTDTRTPSIRYTGAIKMIDGQMYGEHRDEHGGVSWKPAPMLQGAN